MKILVCFIVFLFSTACLAQNDNKLDTILAKCLERYIGHPYKHNGATDGVNILRLDNKDNLLVVSSLYVSDNRFQIPDMKDLQANLNKRCKSVIGGVKTLIVPVYFYYDEGEGLKLPVKVEKKLNNKLRSLKRKGFIISSQPVVIIEFELVH